MFESRLWIKNVIVFLVLKAPCVPETCPNGFTLLSDQTSSANCYSNFGLDMDWPWEIALVSISINPHLQERAGYVENKEDSQTVYNTLLNL